MDSINIYEKRIGLLKEALDKYLEVKDKKEENPLENSYLKFNKKSFITDLSNEVSNSQYAVAEDLKGEQSRKLLVELIKANNSLPKRDRYDIWCPYNQGFEIDEPFFNLLENNGFIKSYYEKAIMFSINPEDYRLAKIMEDIVSKDDLRPLMTAINFKGTSAVGTDAHKLIHVTGFREGNFEDGTYYPIQKIEKDFKDYIKKYEDLKDLSFEEYKKTRFKLDGNYPNYMAVLPNTPTNKVNVNIPLLYSLFNNLINNSLVNLTTFQVHFDVLDMENNYVRITLNIELLRDLFKSFLLLGMKDMQMCFSTPTKAVMFTEVGLDWDAYTKESILTKTNFGLAMPVIMSESKAPIVKINENGGVDFIANTNVSVIAKESVFGKKSMPKTQVKEIKTPLKKDSTEKEYLTKKIESFEMLLEIESDNDEKKFLKEKIEAFKMLLELE